LIYKIKIEFYQNWQILQKLNKLLSIDIIVDINTERIRECIREIELPTPKENIEKLETSDRSFHSSFKKVKKIFYGKKIKYYFG